MKCPASSLQPTLSIQKSLIPRTIHSGLQRPLGKSLRKGWHHLTVTFSQMIFVTRMLDLSDQFLPCYNNGRLNIAFRFFHSCWGTNCKWRSESCWEFILKPRGRVLTGANLVHNDMFLQHCNAGLGRMELVWNIRFDYDLCLHTRGQWLKFLGPDTLDSFIYLSNL